MEEEASSPSGQYVMKIEFHVKWISTQEYVVDNKQRNPHVIILDNIIIAMCDIALGKCARGSRSGTAGAVGCILIISHNCSWNCRSQT